MYEETRSKLESKELELKLELEARQNREMQIVEMEDTLNKETERAQDLKVSSFFTEPKLLCRLYSSVFLLESDCL